MPNLIQLPNGLVLIPAALIAWIMLRGERVNPKIVYLFFLLVAFDQLNVTFSGMLIEPLKMVALAILIRCVLATRVPRIPVWQVLFVSWLILRDAVSFLTVSEHVATGLRYSLQLYFLYVGTFLAANYLAQLSQRTEISKAAVGGLRAALVFSAVLGVYQYFAYQHGWPINSVRNAFTDAHGVVERYAAFSIEGISFFRPYALFGEPKFLGAFAVTLYAYHLFCYGQQLITAKMMIFVFTMAALVLLLAASISAWISFVLVSFLSVLSNRRIGPISIVFVAVLLALVGLANELVPLEEVWRVRLDERLTEQTSALEEHEADYLGQLVSSVAAAIFGLGYSAFLSSMAGGFRAIPNSTIIFIGVCGGATLIFLYVMTILRSQKHFREMAVFLPAGIIFTTPTIYFILIFVSGLAYQALNNQRSAMQLHHTGVNAATRRILVGAR